MRAKGGIIPVCGLARAVARASASKYAWAPWPVPPATKGHDRQQERTRASRASSPASETAGGAAASTAVTSTSGTASTAAASTSTAAPAPSPPSFPFALRIVRAVSLAIALAMALLLFAGCKDSSDGGIQMPGEKSETTGPPFSRAELALSPFDEYAAQGANGALIDVSHVEQGYVAACATSPARLKFEVASGGTSYYFDLPGDGTPLSCPLVMGDGSYTFTIWENTSGQSYVELASVPDQQVALADELQPFVRPNAYCSYDAASASTQLANELCASAQNEGDALKLVYEWIVENITYDEGKASQLADATGYVPNPDATVSARSGICFDYASLAAAMLRSQGIPCKIVTGYVAPDSIYHAWNMVYIDGTWVGAHINVQQGTWTRIDTTFAAGGGSSFVGDGTTYTDRYTY